MTPSLSVVQDERDPGTLKVQARRRAHLRRVFPGARIHQSAKTDYRFRVLVPRGEVVAAVAGEVGKISYGNFKGSVRDHDLHDMYSLWWGDHLKLQEKRGSPK